MHAVVLISLIGVMSAVLAWAIIKIVTLKYLYMQKIISKKVIDCPFFSTSAVHELSRFILKQPKEKKQRLLALIEKKQFSKVMDEIDSPLLKAKIKLMVDGRITLSQNKETAYILMLLGFELKRRHFDKASRLLQKLKTRKLDSCAKASYKLSEAQMALFEGDMLIATADAASALKVFQKKGFLFEEAYTYFVLGNAYRVSGVFDAADFMLRAALKLFRFQKAGYYTAETLGTLGLLMAVQKRFDEAQAYFEDAQKVFYSIGDCENFNFIISQQAMLNLLQGKTKEASELALESLRNHQSLAGKALAADIISRAAFVERKWRKACSYAENAAEKYLKEKNFAAGFESRYLVSECLANLNRLDKAEKTLRELIQQEQYHKSCFHIAAAQTLLGVILLQQGNIKGAKTILNQALKQELRNDRDIGVAIDYANLAAVEKKCGNFAAAKKNLEMALIYAKETDEKLYAAVKAALD